MGQGLSIGSGLFNFWRSKEPAQCPTFFLITELLKRDSEGFIRHDSLNLFPPRNIPSDLLNLLFPSHLPKLKWSSERELPFFVYLTSPENEAGPDDALEAGFPNRGEKSQFTLINFNPWIRFKGLKSLPLSPWSERLNFKGIEQDTTLDYMQSPIESLQSEDEVKAAEEARKKDGPLPGSRPSSSPGGSNLMVADTNRHVSWLRTERALWTYKRKGFRFVWRGSQRHGQLGLSRAQET